MEVLESVKKDFSQHVKILQDQITARLLEIDPQIKLVEDVWERLDFNGENGGGGITRAFEGEIIENAGVNTSLIYGAVDPQFAQKIGSSNGEIWATGISLIIHPRNPKIPTVHANFRMIQGGDKFWFGGGADLTPYYPYPDDFKYFHDCWKDACKKYDCYDKMKDECDKYFVNHHRGGEMRGIGGIFFDHYNTGNIEADSEMVKDLSNHFIDSYFPIVEKRASEKWSDEDEKFQLFRHGRYVEFNLIHDRGTHFGLKSNGRVDSILISLPKRCEFTYRFKTDEGSVHEKMMEYYYPRKW